MHSGPLKNESTNPRMKQTHHERQKSQENNSEITFGAFIMNHKRILNPLTNSKRERKSTIKADKRPKMTAKTIICIRHSCKGFH